jgi:hypothetical protein
MSAGTLAAAGTAPLTAMRRHAVLLAAATLFACCALTAAHPVTITSGQALLAAAVVLLGVAPLVAYLWAGAIAPFPLLALNGLFYAVSFGLAAFYPRLDWLEGTPAAVTMALGLTVAGLGLQYLGYWLFGLVFAGPRAVRLPSAPLGRLRTWAWIFLAAHLAYQLEPRLNELPSIRHLLYPMGWLAMGLLYMQHLRRELPAWQRVVFFAVALPVELLSRWATGALYEVVLVFVFLGLVTWRVRRRLPLTALALMVPFFVLANPVKLQYRSILRGPLGAEDALTRAQVFADLVVDRYRDGSEAATEVATSSSVNRAGQIAVFAHVVELTPASVPHWDGETYGFFLASVVPRILWPDKPTAGFGTAFGHRYTLIHPDNHDTTVNLPWLVEFYVNYGVAGVLLGMPLVGLALRFVTRSLGSSGRNDAEYVLGVALLFQLFFAESNLALMWGGLLLSSIALYAVLQVATRVDPL